MKFVKQNIHFPIFNLDKIINKKSNNKKHGELFPDSIRCIICGPSNCGKTNVILNLLFSPKGLFFENVYVFSKSLHQSKYIFLQCVLGNMSEIGYYPFSDSEEVPHPNEVKQHSVVIFDDVTCCKQKNIKNYFSMGRHNEVDTFYICQTYSYVPKQLVRDNSNLIIVFKQDNRNLYHIYGDHVNTDMSFEQFKELCANVWKKSKNSFVVIDKDSELNKGRYRAGFDIFITN